MIYYSHFNEDSSLEKELLNEAKANLLICVAGSGERVISLINCPTVQKVDIVDVNVDALYLTELKICALKHLDVEAYLSFIGFSISNESRYDMLITFSDQLSADCLKFWQQRVKTVENGICYSGHFEKYLNRIRPIVKTILGKQFYQCFNKSTDHSSKFPRWRWKILKWIFSQRFIYILTGMTDPAFISDQSRLNVIPQALQKTIDEGRVESSAFFHLIFKGHLNDMPAEFLPYSFNPSFLAGIKERLDSKIEIAYHQCDILEYFQSTKDFENNNLFISLSDILSFVKLDYCLKLFIELKNSCKDRCTVLLRAFLRNRVSKLQQTSIEQIGYKVEDVSAMEMSGMYQVLKIAF